MGAPFEPMKLADWELSRRRPNFVVSRVRGGTSNAKMTDDEPNPPGAKQESSAYRENVMHGFRLLSHTSAPSSDSGERLSTPADSKPKEL